MHAAFTTPHACMLPLLTPLCILPCLPLLFEWMQFAHSSKYAGGLAMSADQGSLYGGHDGGMLFALNATTGTKMWKFDTMMTPACPIRTGGNLAVAEGLAFFGCGTTLWAVNTTVAGGLLSWSAEVVPGGGVVTGVSYHPQQAVEDPGSPSLSQLSGTVLATGNDAGNPNAILVAYSAYDGHVRIMPSPSPWASSVPCTNVMFQVVPSSSDGACAACVYVACSGSSGSGGNTSFAAAAAAVYAFALDLSFEQSSWSLFWYSSVSAGVGSGLAVGLSGEVYYGTTQVAAVQAVSAFQ